MEIGKLSQAIGEDGRRPTEGAYHVCPGEYRIIAILPTLHTVQCQWWQEQQGNIPEIAKWAWKSIQVDKRIKLGAGEAHISQLFPSSRRPCSSDMLALRDSDMQGARISRTTRCHMVFLQDRFCSATICSHAPSWKTTSQPYSKITTFGMWSPVALSDLAQPGGGQSH